MLEAKLPNHDPCIRCDRALAYYDVARVYCEACGVVYTELEPGLYSLESGSAEKIALFRARMKAGKA